MNKNHKYILIYVGFITLWLTACGSASTPTEVAPREQWITDWLEHPTCQPPCWENITVGITTITETINILNNMPGVITPGPLKNEDDNEITIWWEFLGNRGQSRGDAGTDANGSIIDELELGTANNQLVMVEEVVQTYNAPDYVLIRNCMSELRTFCTIHLIYNKGLALQLFLQSKHDIVNVSSDSRVGLISFFVPGIQGYLNVWIPGGLNNPAALMKWEGYGEYSSTLSAP